MRDGDREAERCIDQPKRNTETPREEETERALRWAQTSVQAPHTLTRTHMLLTPGPWGAWSPTQAHSGPVMSFGTEGLPGVCVHWPQRSLAVCRPASGVSSGRWARALCPGKAPTHTHTVQGQPGAARVNQGPALESPGSARIWQRSTWVCQGEPVSASAGARGWVGAEASRRLGAADEPWVRAGPECRWAGWLRDPPAPLRSNPRGLWDPWPSALGADLQASGRSPQACLGPEHGAGRGETI